MQWWILVPTARSDACTKDWSMAWLHPFAEWLGYFCMSASRQQTTDRSMAPTSVHQAVTRTCMQYGVDSICTHSELDPFEPILSMYTQTVPLHGLLHLAPGLGALYKNGAEHGGCPWANSPEPEPEERPAYPWLHRTQLRYKQSES